jgi:hypothetical protein
MIADHAWQECRPALLAPAGHDPNYTAMLNRAIIVVWRRMTPQQRQRFHLFTCRDDRTPDTAELMTWMRTQISTEHARLMNLN